MENCQGDWSSITGETVPGLNPKAVCALCGVHWSDHVHETPMRCYTVTGPSGAWINSHSGGPAGWSLQKARQQAKSREMSGLGKHTVEVRVYLGFDKGYGRDFKVVG